MVITECVCICPSQLLVDKTDLFAHMHTSLLVLHLILCVRWDLQSFESLPDFADLQHSFSFIS